MEHVRSRTLAVTAVAAAVAALLTGGAPPAAAAVDDGTLKVITINRSGEEIVVHGVSVTNSGTGVLRQIDSGVTTLLPPGRYRIGTKIQEPDGTDSLAGTIVTVRSGAATPVTFDARTGREVKVGFDETVGSGYTQELLARICDGDVPFSGTTDGPGKLFVIPDAAQGAVLGFGSVWTADSDVMEVVSGGDLSTPPVAQIDMVTLGTVNVDVRQGPGYDTTTTPVVTPSAGCMQGASGTNRFTLTPYRRTYHLNMGDWSWFYGGGVSASFVDQTIEEGRTTSLVFDGAVAGPARYLPWVGKGTLGFFTGGMFADPVLARGELTVNADVTLYRGATPVASRKGLGNTTDSAIRTFYGPVSTSAWYTLKAHAVRQTSGEPLLRPERLSTAADVAFRFHAGPGSNAVAPGFLTRFVPAGLALDNSAASDTDTAIALTLDRTSTQAGVPMWPSTVKKVEVFASPDGGGSWHPLTVTHTSAGWSATLPAPGTPTSVSLSARVTDTGGNTSVSTVYRAFTSR